MGGRRALLLGAASAAFAAACGKSRREPPSLSWHLDPEGGYADATRAGRPVLLFFGASWDCASKELEHRTFPDPEVATLLHESFVLVKIDCSDDEDPEVQKAARRFHMLGTPTLIVMHAAHDRELARVHEYVAPGAFVPILREALARHRAIV